jgi:hypothetical protein
VRVRIDLEDHDHSAFSLGAESMDCRQDSEASRTIPADCDELITTVEIVGTA